MLGGGAGASCRLSRMSGVRQPVVTTPQGEERRTSRKFLPGSVLCEDPDLLLYGTL